jgi:hypothetical protein
VFRGVFQMQDGAIKWLVSCLHELKSGDAGWIIAPTAR